MNDYNREQLKEISKKIFQERKIAWVEGWNACIKKIQDLKLAEAKP